MDFPWIKPSLLARDQKLFLQLSTEEADLWLPRVFERISPQIDMIYGLVYDDDTREPLNLELALTLTMRTVREVAQEMADGLLSPERLEHLLPVLNLYCDELLAQDRVRDATYIQNGLIQMKQCARPAQNPLLVEICVRSIFHQVELFNDRMRGLLWSQ
jgi:hypothetical protein